MTDTEKLINEWDLIDKEVDILWEDFRRMQIQLNQLERNIECKMKARENVLNKIQKLNNK